MIDIKDVTRLISDTLDHFWPNIPVYLENQEGGFSEPSFYVHRICVNHTKDFTGWQNRMYSYQVIYFPPGIKPHEELDTMAEQLQSNLTEIPGYAKLINQDLAVEDEHLSMTFDLNIRAYPKEKDPPFGGMKYQGGVADGR